MLEFTLCGPGLFDILNLATLVPVIVGFGLGLIPNYLQRRSRLKLHWEALAAEVELCADFAGTYLSDKIKAPLYRLPEAAFATSFPALLSDADVEGEEIRRLESFWCWVQDINRGLDNADAERQEKNSQLLDAEVGRLESKCRELLENKRPPVLKILALHVGKRTFLGS